MKLMLVLNLHEVEFLEQTLKTLASEGVRDCVVREVEGVPSQHGGAQLGEAILGSIGNLFKQDRNMNYLIQAVADESAVESITARLAEMRKEERYAASFWFIPIQDYFYHKPNDLSG